MRTRLGTLSGLAFALALAATAKAEPLKVVTESPPLPPGYARLTVHSDRIGRDFSITVNTPSATPFLPGQKLPVIYALDSGYGLAGPQGALLSNTLVMEPAIIVSVGYLPGQALFRNTDLLHNRLTTDTPVPYGGGGAAVEAVLLEDLKPFIEAKYPADPAKSVLFGHSFGGLFTANVFADKPDAFWGYIIGSASAWADPGLVARVAAAAPKAHGAHIYLTVGEKEGSGRPGGSNQMTDGYNGLLKALKGQPGIELKSRLYKGETHLSYYPRLVTDGFPAVLPPPMPLGTAQARLPAATLAKYVGDYRLADGRLITVSADKDGYVTGKIAGLGGGVASVLPLMQNGVDRFYAPSGDLNATFDGTGVSLEGTDGGTLRAERVAKAP